MQHTGKLELTWVGKYKQHKIEPRILVEEKSKSYGDPNSENMLIHGDNLIALQALQQDYAGKVKCIYIDPPYNTGNAFEHYDDSVEHSIWLQLMKERLVLLWNLLSDDGSIWISIDDKEIHYLKVLCDELFGRHNFIIQTTIKRGAATGHKAINPTPVQVCDYMLVYAKDKTQWEYQPVYAEREYDKAYGKYILNIEEPYEKWEITTVKEILKERKVSIDDLIATNADSIIRFAQPDYSAVGQDIRALIDESKDNPSKIFYMHREDHPDIYLLGGDRILFYKDKLRKIGGKYVTAELVTNLWLDMNYQGIAKEGNVKFTKSKKPEAQVERILLMATKPGDIVLDSFLGSGTTAAVAHKMNRRWIGVELGEHCYSLCIPRLQKVISGDDPNGITKAVNWQGGGGYHFYELAPSLLVKNKKLPIYQINPEFTFEMLCEAICKIEGFKYEPKGVFHGHSSEKRFIHITREFVNAAYIKSVTATLGDGQSLLIYGTKIQSDLRLPDNVEVKKIPKDLLKKCEFESEVR